MNYDKFIRDREKDWKELENTLEKMKSGDADRLTRYELNRLGKLYRSATSNLAVARNYFPSSQASLYLNQLVAKAHASIYKSRPTAFKNIFNFFYYDVPNVFRKRFGYIALAFIVFSGASLLGFLGCYFVDDLPRIIIGNEYIDKTLSNISKGDPVAVYKTGFKPLASSIIMTNNIGVSFFAFSLGIFMGIGTAFILFLNGLMLGSITFVFYQHNYAIEFLSTVMIHGTIELSCIFIAGGAGFLLGDALINPKNQFRKDALVKNGRESIQLILAIIPWLIISGIIEGYVTPMDLTLSIRLAVIGITGALFFIYFAFNATKRTQIFAD